MLGTGAGIIFKGSGFYATDYRSDSYRQAAGSEGKKENNDTGGAKSAEAASPSGGAKKGHADA